MDGGVLFVFVFWGRFLSFSRASISSICLIRIASSLSSASFGWSICFLFPSSYVKEMISISALVFILTSFPFFVTGAVSGAGLF
jgi:hypothetical protein